MYHAPISPEDKTISDCASCPLCRLEKDKNDQLIRLV